jgi:flagellum-specific ATP synthase
MPMTEARAPLAAPARSAPSATGSQAFSDMLSRYRAFAQAADPIAVHGRLVRVAGLVLEATGLRLPVGSVCRVEQAAHGERQSIEAEVVGFGDDRLYLMPTGLVHGLSPGARVSPVSLPVRAPALNAPSHPWRRSTDRMRHLPIGHGLLGRVIDARGEPLDKGGPLLDVRHEPIQRRPISAMERDPVRTPLDTGIRAINACSPSAAASAWACSPARASARAC